VNWMDQGAQRALGAKEGPRSKEGIAMARINYDIEAERYQSGRHVPLEHLEGWRQLVGKYMADGPEPILDLGAGTGIWMHAFSAWFAKPVIGVEPSAGMRHVAMANQDRARDANTWLVAGRDDAIPLASATCSAAWLSTVVHHLKNLRSTATELRRVLTPGAAVLFRNSFPPRHEEIMLFRFFEGARRIGNTFPTVEKVVEEFSAAGFEMIELVRVREPSPASLQDMRDWVTLMRHTDSALAPLSDDEFAEGLSVLDKAIASGEPPTPLGLDLLVLA
jgi:ubiquinone/menaquinone biosynthesis C-methylase UbiE